MGVKLGSDDAFMYLGSTPVAAYLASQEVSFNPRSVSGLYAWYDVSDSSAVTLNATTISELSDKSGGGRHMLQDTALNQPVYTANGRNGRAVATFDGSATFMEVASVSLPQPFTVIAAYQNTEISLARFLLSGSGVTSMMTARSTGGSSGFALGSPFTPIATTNNWQIQHNVGNGASSVVARNLDADNVGNAGTNSPTSLVLGANGTATSAFFAGPLGELVIYNRALTRTEREQLVRYFANRWGITV
jgi:hypothetical protein